jgi:serine/threonine-protein kinase HipA
MKLDVQVRSKTVAQLYREHGDYLLKYLPGATNDDFVSLTMPVREEPWRWPRDLHPFFRQNLPEGYLLSVIREEFGPLLDGTDLSLLGVVGGMSIGRVTVTPEGVAPGNDLKALDIEHLLTAENSRQTFSRLVRTYARAAISGAVPKFLAPDELAQREPLGKQSFRTSRHIVKGSDEATPYLGFNEHYSMRVLARLNVTPVAKTRMSHDGRVLVVDRFDTDEKGIPVCGVEDACGLLGLPPNEKYRPSTEAVLKATRAYIPATLLRAQRESFGWHLLVNYVVRNADCYAKNIALYYPSRTDVVYTPAYDIVTTQAYPRYAHNSPGLSVMGRKTWAPGKALEQFFKVQLGIAPSAYRDMVERLCQSAVEVGCEVIEAVKNEPRWQEVGTAMAHAWNEGMASVRSVKPNPALMGLTRDIEAAELGAPAPPERPKRVGHSELLARRGRHTSRQAAATKLKGGGSHTKSSKRR